MKKRPPISRFTVAGNVVWLKDVKPGYLMELDGEYCLVRIRDEDGNWSEPVWIKAYDGPIIGTPPKETADLFRKEVDAVPSGRRPDRPARKRPLSSQGDLFW